MEASKYCLVFMSVVLVTGVIMCLLGGAMFPVFKFIIHNEIVTQTKLVNGTMGYDSWSGPTQDSDIHMQFWVWNLTNPAEVKEGKKKPFVVQIGPYTYREEMRKQNITTHSNGTISYVQNKVFIFDPSMSVGNPKVDKFISINIPKMTVAGMYDHLDLSPIEKFALKIAIRGEDVFVSHTVHDILWGYPDILMRLAHSKGLAPSPNFGLFLDRNNSNDGVYTVYSGVNKADTSKINDITRWKGESELSIWSSDQANMINGTDGAYNPPFTKQDEKLYVFSSDICRSINAVYEQSTEVQDIKTWRFVGPPSAFANASSNPANVGFCTPDSSHCLPSGLLNVSNCQFGAPIVMSLPHFLFCDKIRVIDLVNGVIPNKEEHQTFFDIEPMTGGPLNVAKRLQINVHLQPFEEFPKLKNLAKLYLPVLWLNESGHLTKDGADSLHENIVTPILMTTIAKWATLGLGIALILLAATGLTIVWILRKSEGNSEETKPIYSASVNTESGTHPINSSSVGAGDAPQNDKSSLLAQ